MSNPPAKVTSPPFPLYWSSGTTQQRHGDQPGKAGGTPALLSPVAASAAPCAVAVSPAVAKLLRFALHMTHSAAPLLPSLGWRVAGFHRPLGFAATARPLQERVQSLQQERDVLAAEVASRSARHTAATDLLVPMSLIDSQYFGSGSLAPRLSAPVYSGARYLLEV